MNAQCKLGSSLALQSFLVQHVEETCWDVIFVSELCSYSSSFACRPYDVDNFRIIPHYAGPGSHPMAFIVKHDILNMIASVDWLGRSGAIQFRSSGRQKPLVVLGVHGAHGSGIIDTFSDLSSLLGNFDRTCPLVCLGDYNIDLSPVRHDDPLATEAGRNTRHAQRRLCLYNWLETHSCEIVDPSCVRSVPYDALESWFFFPWTHKPPDLASANPSILDFVVKRNVHVEYDLDWKSGAGDDHAGMHAVVHTPTVQMKEPKKSVWRCKDTNAFLEEAKTVDVGSLSTHTDLMTVIQQLQDKYKDSSTCAARRYCRMPFALRVAYFKKASATNDADYTLWCKRVRVIRQHWISKLRDARTAAMVSRGKTVQKSKKLHDIMGICDGTQKFLNVSDCADRICKAFFNKWSRNHENARLMIMDRVFAHDLDVPHLHVHEIRNGITSCRHRSRLDSDGICLKALELIFSVHPVDLTNWFNGLVSSTVAMSSLHVFARAAGKESSVSPLDKIRLILPQSSILSILDVAFAERLNSFLDTIFPLDTSRGIYTGGVKHTQTLDIAHGIHLALDRGLDLMSDCAVAQADVRTYFDKLPITSLALWLEQKGFSKASIACVLRQQMIIQVCVRFKHCPVTPFIKNRAIGGLTGSRVALALSRIPIATLFESLYETHACFAFQGRLFAASWIVNLFFVSNTAFNAIQTAEKAALFLKQQWGLEFKPGSTKFICARGTRQTIETHEVPDRWEQVNSFVVLGHIVQDNCATNLCVRQAFQAAWRAFWANIACSKARNLATRHKLACLTRCVKPILSFRWARWPFHMSVAKDLDRLQRNMLRQIFRCVRFPGETDAFYFRRSARYVGAIQREIGSWSREWALSICLWAAHLMRNTKHSVWSAQLLNVRPASELQLLRSQNAGSPMTRISSGYCAKRWSESVINAIAYLRQDHLPRKLCVKINELFDQQCTADIAPLDFYLSKL